MVLVRCVQTDLPKSDRKRVTDAVRVLYERIVDGEESSKEVSKKKNKAGRLGDYCKSLKQSLDNAFQPHWHVLAGNSLGFACKYRKQSCGVWHIFPPDKENKDNNTKSERLMVVIWKSPGIEVITPESEEVEGEKAETEKLEADDKIESENARPAEDSALPETQPAAGSASLHVIQPHAADIEAGSEVERVIGVLRESVRQNSSAEAVKLSKLIRRHLTKEVGTIWHVAVGRDFVIEPAVNRTNFVLASLGKDYHIVCFQHEQKDPPRINWKRIISSLPWLLVVLICFGYMMFHNICEKDDRAQPAKERSGLSLYLYNRICTKEDWEMEFGVMALLTLASSLIAKKMCK